MAAQTATTIAAPHGAGLTLTALRELVAAVQDFCSGLNHDMNIMLSSAQHVIMPRWLEMTLVSRSNNAKMRRIEAAWNSIESIPPENAKGALEIADGLNKIVRSCERCEGIAEGCSWMDRLSLHFVLRNMAWLAEHSEDLAETIALSVHEPFTELVSKELAAHGLN